jgi:hypothetical protein
MTGEQNEDDEEEDNAVESERSRLSLSKDIPECICIFAAFRSAIMKRAVYRKNSPPTMRTTNTEYKAYCMLKKASASDGFAGRHASST